MVCSLRANHSMIWRLIVPTRKRPVPFLAAASLAAATGVAVLANQPSAEAWGATYKPDLTTPMVLVDGAAFRGSIWLNFQAVVKNCMDDAGYVYQPAPAPPADTRAAALPVLDPAPTAPTTKSFNVTSSVRYEPPAFGYGGPGYVASNAPGYFMALRGFTVASTSDKYLKSLDRQAHDGVNSTKFGATAADTKGCEAFARERVSEPAVAAMQQVDLAAGPILGDFLFGDATDAASVAWADCMQARGFSYTSVLEPSEDINSKSAALIESSAPDTAWTALETREQQTATNSDQCMLQSGLTVVIDGDLQQAWEAFRDSNLTLLHRAGGAVNAGTNP